MAARAGTCSPSCFSNNPSVGRCPGRGALSRLRRSTVSKRVFSIKRNRARFPEDFAFQLNLEEWSSLRSQIVTLKGRGQHRKYRPWVFTEHGSLMAATVLNSERAVAMSVYVVRAFVKIRRELLANAVLEKRLSTIEKTLIGHDAALRDLYQKIRPLLLPPKDKPKRRIGFHEGHEHT